MVSDVKAVSLPSLINILYVSSLSVSLFKSDSHERTSFILQNAHPRLTPFLWEGTDGTRESFIFYYPYLPLCRIQGCRFLFEAVGGKAGEITRLD